MNHIFCKDVHGALEHHAMVNKLTPALGAKGEAKNEENIFLCYELNERSQFSFASRKKKKPYGTRLLTHITNLIPHRRNV